MATPAKQKSSSKNKVVALRDGLRNLVANLGTDRDKSAHNFYTPPFLTDEQLSAAYRGAWLPKKIVNIIPQDACRAWRAWDTENTEDVAKIEALENKLGLQKKTAEAMKKARLFGGAAIYIGTDAQDVKSPLELTETIKHLTVISCRKLTAGPLSTDPDSLYYGEPQYYEIVAAERNQVTVHPSRLIIYHGTEVQDSDLALVTAGGRQGWGDSVLMAAMEAVHHADSTVANVASLVFEAKVDVIKIPDFMSNLDDPEYEAQVIERVTLAATAKGINGALLMDKEEDYEQKSANFSSLRDIIMAMMQVVSGACDIPMTRLLGMSPGGLQSTGESDIRNYYDHIGSVQTLDITPAMALFDQLLVINALGVTPDGIDYDWNPLWQTTAIERAEIGKITADTIKTLADTNLYDDESLTTATANMLAERGVISGVDDVQFNDEPDPEPQPGVEGVEGVEADGRVVGDGTIRPLYVSRKVLNRKDIVDWAKSQGITDVVSDLHVTLIYSRDPVDWLAMGTTWDQDSDGKIHIPPGGARDVDRYDGGAVVIEFVNSSLDYRQKRMIESGASFDYDEYKPHITVVIDELVDISKIAPYNGPIVLGPEIFEEIN